MTPDLVDILFYFLDMDVLISSLLVNSVVMFVCLFD
jgi:hypothetical protein